MVESARFCMCEFAVESQVSACIGCTLEARDSFCINPAVELEGFVSFEDFVSSEDFVSFGASIPGVIDVSCGDFVCYTTTRVSGESLKGGSATGPALLEEFAGGESCIMVRTSVLDTLAGNPADVGFATSVKLESEAPSGCSSSSSSSIK